MITDEDLAAAGLKRNPFSLLPDEGIEVWAGRAKLKTRLLDVVESARNDHVGLSEFVILHGDYGAGKSHALMYLQWLIGGKKSAEFRSPAIYIPNMRTSDKPTFLDLYAAIISRLGRAALTEMASSVIGTVQARHDELHKSASADELRETGHEEKIWKQAKTEVLGHYSEQFNLLDRLGRNEDVAWFYFSCSDTKLTPGNLSLLGVPGPIDSGFQSAMILGMIVNVGCRIKLPTGKPFWNAFYLFVDEVEGLIDLPTGSILSFNSGFRDLLNQCPEGLCLIFGFSGEAAEVQTVVDQAVFDRMTRSPPYPLPPLDTEEAVTFIQEILASYRTDAKKFGPWHPFTEDAVRYVVDSATDKTPRKIFRSSRIVLDRAASAGLIRKGGVIDRDKAEDFLIDDKE